jgi:hypothetical protein
MESPRLGVSLVDA